MSKGIKTLWGLLRNTTKGEFSEKEIEGFRSRLGCWAELLTEKEVSSPLLGKLYEGVLEQIAQQMKGVLTHAKGADDYAPAISFLNVNLADQLVLLAKGRSRGVSLNLKRTLTPTIRVKPWFVFGIEAVECTLDRVDELVAMFASQGRIPLSMEEVIAWLLVVTKGEKEMETIVGDEEPKIIRLSLAAFLCVGGCSDNDWPVLVSDQDVTSVTNRFDSTAMITSRKTYLVSADWSHCFLPP